MAMNALRDRLIKNSTIKQTSVLTDSILFNEKEVIKTAVPMINVALGGSVDGGMTAGLTMLAGPSKHFKTAFALLLTTSFLEKHKDGIVLFYDSEFGTPTQYFESFNIPSESVVHTPITDIEQLKFDIMKQLSELKREDKVIIIVDSIGNLASKKEIEDALSEKSAADMTRAKQLKSLFRMVTPHLTLKNIPMVVVNHTYKEISLFPKDIVGGGTGSYYSADNIWILGRQQDKDSSGLNGYHFIINIEKSRYVKEKSKIPITVSFDGGINKWSGLFDIALEGKFIVPGVKKSYYHLVDTETGELQEPIKEKDIIDNDKFWSSLLKNTKFVEYIQETYQISRNKMLKDETEE